MPFAACYSLDLYCRHSKFNPACVTEGSLHDFEEFPHNYTGQTWGECKRAAQKGGWIFHKDGEVTCPKCANYLRPQITQPPPTFASGL